MVASTSASSSLRKYLKERYLDSNEEEKKKKKKRKKVRPHNTGVLVFDEDPIWQKPVKLEEEEDYDAVDEERPQVDEDIEVKRMKRLEQLRSRHPFGAISEDGSGWVSISDAPKKLNFSDQISDISPPSRRRADTPSPEHELKHSSGRDADISPPHKERAQNDTPSPLTDSMLSSRRNDDLSPPRKRRAQNDSSSPEPEHRSSKAAAADLSFPHRQQKRNQNPLTEPGRKHPYSLSNDLKDKSSHDISPQYRQRFGSDAISPRPILRPLESGRRVMEFSPPRWQNQCHSSPSPDPDPSTSQRVREDNLHTYLTDLSPPRKVRKGRYISDDISTRQPSRVLDQGGATLATLDLSTPRKQKESAIPRDQPKTGLVTGQDIEEEIAKTKKEYWLSVMT